MYALDEFFRLVNYNRGLRDTARCERYERIRDSRMWETNLGKVTSNRVPMKPSPLGYRRVLRAGIMQKRMPHTQQHHVAKFNSGERNERVYRLRECNRR